MKNLPERLTFGDRIRDTRDGETVQVVAVKDNSYQFVIIEDVGEFWSHNNDQWWDIQGWDACWEYLGNFGKATRAKTLYNKLND